MDALLAAAGPLRGDKRKRDYRDRNSKPQAHKTVQRGDKEAVDPSTASILRTTRTPSSFHSRNLASGKGKAPIKPEASVHRIQDKKVRAKVARQDVAAKQAAVERADVNEWINAPLSGGQGGIDVDYEAGERTWKVSQDAIVDEVGIASSSKRFDLRFDDWGSYKVDYTRNGRHLAIASSKGHVATFDWQAGKLLSEIQLKESVRDIKFLQSESFYAVAQKKYVFIYDENGVELHKLKHHIDPTHMEYLPYHYLLSTVGNAGHLKYHDVSTGVMLTQIATHLGSPSTMAQNPHSAIIHLGHANGTMTLWSPNQTTPHVKLLAHRGPVAGIAVDPSEDSVGRYCATAGLDGTVKLWDGRMWGKELRSWTVRNQPATISYSGRGILAVGGRTGVTTYRDVHKSSVGAPSPYLTLPLPGLSAYSTKFCPFDDIIAVGHNRGISSLLVPGSGEANFDSAEADVYETYSRRRERDVRSVMDKIRPELITMDTDYLGHISLDKGGQTHAEREGRSFRQLGRMERLRATGKADEDEDEWNGINSGDEGADANAGERPAKKEKVRHKQRGKGTGMKRYLAKKKKNVVDKELLAVRDKVEAQKRAEEMERKVASGEVVKESGALARFG
ncbi:putative U3 small nucleolar RNA-associated protein 7 [Vanrija albida]|uniref:U3 small nucleolar RNA-associated protein 7 n=1 Tax=Vanrija albida TaxID=181172 RepID=A0ABR3PYB2_9TREE